MQATRRRAPQRSNGATTAPPVAGSSILLQASRAHRVPVWVLAGVKLMETGASLNTPNPFQFEPGTAASAGVRNVNNFSEAANGAAKLLRSYRDQFGSWSAAFEAYNGGPGAVGGGYAYNQRDVEAKLREFGTSRAELGGGGAVTVGFFGDLKKGLDKIFGYSLGGVLGGDKAGEALEQQDLGKLGEAIVGNPLSAIGHAFELLTSGEFWVRAIEVVAGSVLVYLALKSLTGTGISDLPGATAARSAAKL